MWDFFKLCLRKYRFWKFANSKPQVTRTVEPIDCVVPDSVLDDAEYDFICVLSADGSHGKTTCRRVGK